ncbi:MAG: hypothetical protein QGH46_04275 [Gammaproteobacteria bacterium]|jgi:hypothetical protein|nr:hypothetical protein [Gammaproteobacteria bacterium]
MFGEYAMRIHAADDSLFRLLKLESSASYVVGFKADGTVLTKTADKGFFFDAEWRDLEEVLLWADYVDGIVTVDDLRVSFNPYDHLPYVPFAPDSGWQYYIDVGMDRPGGGGNLFSYFNVPPRVLDPEHEVALFIWPGDEITGPNAMYSDVDVTLGENSVTVSHKTYGSGPTYNDTRMDMRGYSVKLDKAQVVTLTGYFQGNWTSANWRAGVNAYGIDFNYYKNYSSSAPAPGRVDLYRQALRPAGSTISWSDNFSGSWGIDQSADVELVYTLTFTDPPVTQVEIDVDPWDAANEVKPNENYGLPVAIMTTSTADGDAADFDALQADPDWLRLGPSGAPNVAIPGPGDFDSDGDSDVAFGFRVEESGILCGDTGATLTGFTYSGVPIEGSDTITTMECQTSACHP